MLCLFICWRTIEKVIDLNQIASKPTNCITASRIKISSMSGVRTNRSSIEEEEARYQKNNNSNNKKHFFFFVSCTSLTWGETKKFAKVTTAKSLQLISLWGCLYTFEMFFYSFLVFIRDLVLIHAFLTFFLAKILLD